MELFDYYKRKGKMKLLIGTGILFLLYALYMKIGDILIGAVYIFCYRCFYLFGNWILAVKKRKVDTKEYDKSNATFWDVDTLVVLELPKRNKQFGLYHPDGKYIAGTKMVSSNILFSVIPFYIIKMFTD